jgi:hypothetical protein
MDLESVSLKLPRDLLSGAQRVATAQDVTIGHLVRQLLKREVERQLSDGQESRVDARLLAALRALLGRDFADASSWENLTDRLRPHGYVLRSSGGDVILHKISCGTRVCTGSELGFDYGALAEHFGCELKEVSHSVADLGIMPAGHIDPTRRAMLFNHIATARSWPDLINRLAIEGMELRLMGAALGIYISATGRHLCNSTTVGARYRTLVMRYGAEMPRHAVETAKDIAGLNPTAEVQLRERG